MSKSPMPLVKDDEGFFHCPSCGNLYTAEHAERKPKFCEECGQPLAWYRKRANEIRFYDREDVYYNCTVQILTNSVTGEQSIGWWPEDEPPREV